MSGFEEIPPELRDLAFRLALRLGERLVGELGKLLRRSKPDVAQCVRAGLAAMNVDDYSRAIKELNKGRKASDSDDERASIGILISQCLDFLEEWKEMRKEAQEVTRLAKLAGRPDLEAMGILLEGVSAAHQHKLGVAQARFETVAIKGHETGDAGIEALGLVNIVGTEIANASYSGEAKIAKAYALLQGTTDPTLLSVCLMNWAKIDMHDKRPQAALNKLQKSLYLVRTQGFLSGECDILNDLGQLAGKIGRWTEATSYFRSALELAKTLNSSRMIAHAYAGLGRLAMIHGDLQEAKQLYPQAIRAAKSVGDRRSEAAATGELALIAIEENDDASAEKHLRKALDIFRELDDAESIAVSAGNLAVICAGNGLEEEAERLFAESLEIYRSMGRRLREVALLLSLAQWRLEQKRPEDARKILEDIDALMKLGGPEYATDMQVLAQSAREVTAELQRQSTGEIGG